MFCLFLRFPNNFIGLAGISAGSGQVVSYIGREGNNVKVNVAARYESLMQSIFNRNYTIRFLKFSYIFMFIK